MTTTTLHAPATPTLGVAFRQLFAAVFAPMQRETAAPRSPAEEANAVRELASQYLNSDPGFAEDLYAAANRYELAHLQKAQA